MNLLTLRVAASYIAWLMVAISVIVLFRGHNAPGGGFIGGMLAALGLAIRVLPVEKKERKAREISPLAWLVVGLAALLVAAFIPMVSGQPPLTAQLWFELPLLGRVGSVLLFDIGVYLVVSSASLLMIYELMEDA